MPDTCAKHFCGFKSLIVSIPLKIGLEITSEAWHSPGTGQVRPHDASEFPPRWSDSPAYIKGERISDSIQLLTRSIAQFAHNRVALHPLDSTRIINGSLRRFHYTDYTLLHRL